MSMSAGIHGISSTSVDVADLGHFATLHLRSGDGCEVTAFPARIGRRSIERDLAELARIGDTLARQARRAAHDRRTRLRTEGIERALKAVAK